jgi:5-methylcytosine-specific restriction protein B
MDKEQSVKNKTKYKTGDSETSLDPMKELIDCCDRLIPVILYGPPGTGKTKMVMDLKRDFQARNALGKFETIQFHRKFTYEDFIEGYKPSENGFVKRDGIFKEFCKNPTVDKVDLFVIDEINRAEIATTFGEALFALEDRESRIVKTAHFSEPFSIPRNLQLIGTMNTADKSIANIDFAIRRRFRFIPVFPDVSKLENWLSKLSTNLSNFTLSEYCKFFERTNKRIAASSQLGPHMQLGEAMFVPSGFGDTAISEEDFLYNFRDVLLPQVEAYLGFGNRIELSAIFGPILVDKFLASRSVSIGDFSGLIKESINDKS